MAFINFKSYEQGGKKLSFANWISNVSPEETPFISMTGKEYVNQPLFNWQYDFLDSPDHYNSYEEGFIPSYSSKRPTTTIQNVTQIFAKTVSVTETADATSNYGRNKESIYQLEKAAKEIKRDVEAAFLNNRNGSTLNTLNTGRKTGGVRALIGRDSVSNLTNELDTKYDNDGMHPADDGGVPVVSEVTLSSMDDINVFEKALFELTSNLYYIGSKANVIMIHPSMASLFSLMQQTKDSSISYRTRIFDNRKDIDVQVNVIIDPLGQEYRIIYNRMMPTYSVFFFNPNDWTQMILRDFKKINLAKSGDSSRSMIVFEAGLRHRNPYASAWLNVKVGGATSTITITKQPQSITLNEGDSGRLEVEASTSTTKTLAFQWYKDNVEIPGAIYDSLAIYPANLQDTGKYKVKVYLEHSNDSLESNIVDVKVAEVKTPSSTPVNVSGFEIKPNLDIKVKKGDVVPMNKVFSYGSNISEIYFDYTFDNNDVSLDKNSLDLTVKNTANNPFNITAKELHPGTGIIGTPATATINVI
ncbi:DUF5309 family protein [Salmonella enterica]|nr:DUF5309 family protein [Salmonella enterica]